MSVHSDTMHRTGHRTSHGSHNIANKAVTEFAKMPRAAAFSVMLERLGVKVDPKLLTFATGEKDPKKAAGAIAIQEMEKFVFQGKPNEAAGIFKDLLDINAHASRVNQIERLLGLV